MAIINGMYIHVTDESITRGVDTTSHPVESGIPTTDTVRARAVSVSISGKIVDYGSMKSEQVVDKLKALQNSGSLIKYQGVNVVSNLQIGSFDAKYSNDNYGGADFSMELHEVRIAKSAYVPKKNSTAESNTKKNPEIDVGSTVIFKGGPVYVSSDATKPAATRGRSTCECTIISKRSWSVHQYHLISKDGAMVYGWVDYNNIEGATDTITSGKTNAGTQQIQSGSKGTSTGTGSSTSSKTYPVYHKVKSGDTVYTLCAQYSYLGKSVSWVISNSPEAFSKPNDATTLKVGAYLLMGYK